MSKTAAAVLAFCGLILFSIPMSAQLIPTGNLYVGASYGSLTNVVNKEHYPRGWNASVEVMPLARYRHFGVVIDGSGFYRNDVAGQVTQYNAFGGIRAATTYGNWRPFIQGMGGIRRVNSTGFIHTAPGYDIGGGIDRKFTFWRFKNFSWRFQGDYMHSHYLTANQDDWRASTGLVWRF